MYDLNLIVPNINSEKYSNERKFLLLKNYLYELNEVLSLSLSGIDYNNLGSALKSGIKNGEQALTVSKKLSAETRTKISALKSDIIRTATEIEQEYKTAIETSEQEILQTASGLYTAKSEFGEYKSQTETALSQTNSQITLNAENTEAVLNDLNEYKLSNDSEIEVTAEAVMTRVGSLYSLKSELDELSQNVSSKITQTAADITENYSSSLSRVNEDLTTLGGEFSEFISSLEVYIKRGELEDGVYGIEIGRSDSAVKARFTNDKLSFMEGATEIAYISGSSLYITRAEVLDYLKLGNTADGYFTFDVTGNGLEVRWNGGN